VAAKYHLFFEHVFKNLFEEKNVLKTAAFVTYLHVVMGKCIVLAH
jgi:hypothetical protein